MTTPASRTVNYDAVLSLSMEYVRPQLVDNIFTSAALLAALYGAFGKKKRQRKGIRLVNGGEQIRVPLMYGKNTTVGSYSGYDTLDVSPQEGITSAYYSWRQLAGSVAISRKEERQNAGEGKIKDLLQAKVMQLDMSLRDELNQQLLGKTVASGVWTAGAGIANQTANADFLPIAGFVPKNPAASRTDIGGINPSTYSWWRSNMYDGSNGDETGSYKSVAVSSWAALKNAARSLYNECSKGSGGPPDLGILSQNAFESYEAALDDKTRYVNDTDGPVTAGFESIRFKGQDLVWDEMVPDIYTGVNYDSASYATETWLMLNMQFLELVLDSQTDFITTPFVRPENQDAKVSQVLVMGNLCSSNQRKHGAIMSITQDLTS